MLTTSLTSVVSGTLSTSLLCFFVLHKIIATIKKKAITNNLRNVDNRIPVIEFFIFFGFVC